MDMSGNAKKVRQANIMELHLQDTGEQGNHVLGGDIMSLPWLINRELLESEGPVDPFVELARLRRLVVNLAPGKDRFAGRAAQS
jgi:hypothetical protein